MKGSNLSLLSSAEVEQHWPAAEEALREALSPGTSNCFLTTLKAHTIAGINQLWTIEKENEIVGYVITNIYTHNGNTNIVQIHYAAGTLDYLLENYDAFECWARNMGIEIIEIVGRNAWGKVMKKEGFRHSYTSFTKHITQELH